MELALIAAKQVGVLFLLILAGFLCVKLRAVRAESKKGFSDLLLYFVVPSMIINSYITQFDAEKLSKLIEAFELSAALLILGLAVSLLAGIRLKGKNAPIVKFSCIFSNAAYMGFPLIEALFGTDGLLYASAFLTIYNILMWTIGYAMLSGRNEPKEILRSICTTPVIISVVIGIIIFALRIPIPDILHSALSSTGSMNTPLSMFIMGMMIAGSKAEGLLKNKLIAFAVVVRLLIVPTVCLLAFALLKISGEVASIVLLLEACPSAAITSVFAVQLGYDEDTAAGAVVMTTLLSIITLPLFAYLITSIL